MLRKGNRSPRPRVVSFCSQVSCIAHGITHVEPLSAPICTSEDMHALKIRGGDWKE